MTRAASLIAALLLFAPAAWIVGRAYDQTITDGRQIAHVRCEEDMPCWNCHTMGNHACGRSITP